MKYEITLDELSSVLDAKSICKQPHKLSKAAKEAVIRFVTQYILDMVNFFLKENNMSKLLSTIDKILLDPNYNFTENHLLKGYSIEPFKVFPDSRCIIEEPEIYGSETCPQRLQNMVLNKNLGFLITAQLLKIVANDLKIANSMDSRVEKATAINIQYFAAELLHRLKDKVHIFFDNTSKENLTSIAKSCSCLVM